MHILNKLHLLNQLITTGSNVLQPHKVTVRHVHVMQFELVMYMQIKSQCNFKHASSNQQQQQQQPELLGQRQHTLTLRAGRGIALEMMSASPVRWSTCAYMAGHCRHEKLYFICRRKDSSTGFNQVQNRFQCCTVLEFLKFITTVSK